MNKTHLGKICGISRQTVHNLLKNGLTEEEILKRYGIAKEILAHIENKELVCLKGADEIYKECKEKLIKQFGDNTIKLQEYRELEKDLQKIKEITKKVVLDNWKSNSDNFDYKDVNEIYDIVKKY